jgi:hypothetical protein
VGDLVFSYEGLAGSGLCRDEDILITADGGDGVLLKGVKSELHFHRKRLGHGATGFRWFYYVQER